MRKTGKIVGLAALILIVIVSVGWFAELMTGGNDKTRIGPEHYQYTYDVRKEWAKHMNERAQEEGLFGYGEYKYQSYLLLFPRETPSTLKEYYFRWSPGMDVDGFACYFTCELTEENYTGFTEGLADFALVSPVGEFRPLYDDEHFEHPAYILQWMEVGEKWQVLEYILLDEAKHTAVFVYCTIGMEDEVEANSAYRIAPNTWNILPEDVMPREMLPMNYRRKEGFSIYGDFEKSEYDLSFLDYLK